MQVLIVVASQTGRTQKMAEAFAEGARAGGGEVVLKSAAEADAGDLEAADAIALGSGIHMAGIESTMRDFLERTAHLWMQGALVGKLGAAFVTAGAGARGGGELGLISLLAALAEHGLLIVPMHNRMEGFASGGCHWGAVAWTNPRGGEAGPTSGQLDAARAHGKHLAECALRWQRGQA